MKKIQLIIGDTDALFLQSFSEYIMASNLKSKFDLKLFSSSSRIKKYIETEQVYDILLIQPELYNPNMVLSEKNTVFFLQESMNDANQSQSVYKYQPLNKILSDMLSVYYEHYSTFQGVAREGIKTKVLSVYSPNGGTGKTTFTINLSKQMALKGNKVFYLNLEFLNTSSLFFQSADDHPSLQVFYYLKARPEQFLSKIESLKKTDETMNVDYFQLPICPDEMIAIKREEIKYLIQAIIETEHYDYILIDLDSSVHERVGAAIEESHQVIWLLNNDIQSFYKTVGMLDRMDDVFGNEHHLEEKVTFIMNRFTGYFPEAYLKFNLPIRGYLPNITEWLQNNDVKQVLYHPLYTKELLAITEDLIVKREAGVEIDQG
ncbi:AAA family ATPase [Lederbergia sp. NSJ-179]|uniref:AAA family ATPase n=1 Tax=Lederbergia sp. NSJ-179 TaxID=2931402 RepID=UPI001FD243BF|nr:AAA family ATPase [Lederbergia sp. NSJ-179]MCJ7840224.1 AAA family ATPase [Lederbergia sp. NSJ-179]